MNRVGERAVRTAVRVYRVLLWAYPKEFREEYGPQIVQAFEDLCRAESRSSGLGDLIELWVRTLWDLAVNALAERGGRARATLTLPGVVEWCGIAAVLGGLLTMFGLSPYTLQGLRLREILSAPALQAISRLQGTLVVLLTAAGLVGICILLGKRRSRLARASAALLCISAVVGQGFSLYGWAIRPPPLELVEEPLPTIIGMAVGGFGRLVGILLLVVAAIKLRMLLRPWGIVLLVLLVFHSPLMDLFVLGSSGPGAGTGPLGMWVPMLRMTLRGAVWITLGCLLFFADGVRNYETVPTFSMPYLGQGVPSPRTSTIVA